MRASSLSIGRIFGIEVRVHASWLLAFFFLTWGLAGGYFRLVAPRQSGFAAPLLLAAISTLFLFACVLVHELSHSLVARALGMRVRDITLFIFGGVSNIAGEAHSARDEFLISAVGPLTSLLLAGVFWLAAQAAGVPPGTGLLFGPTRGVPAPSALGAVLGYLAIVNLLLGLFNLLPAFPLDGGRVLRSILWAITRRFERATVIASLIGQVFAVLLGALGVVRIVVLGDLTGGLWTIFIAWFLGRAASASRQELRLREASPGVPVSDLVEPTPHPVEAGTSLSKP